MSFKVMLHQGLSFVFIAVLLSSLEILEPESCVYESLCHNLGTKTTYDNRQLPHTEKSSLEEDDHKSCVLKSVFYVGRHGSRYPTKKSAIKMQKGGYNLKMNIKNAALLLPKGVIELTQLGARFRERYKSMNFDEASLRFNSSAKERAIQSAEAFMKGFLGHPNGDLIVNPEDSDKILRSHKTCARAKTKVDATVAKEVPPLEEMTLPIFHQAFPGTEKVIPYATMLYDACGLHLAGGCADCVGACDILAEKSDVTEALEYLSDAKDYFGGSLGDKTNLEKTCILRENIVEFLSVGSRKEYPSLQFAFTHAETVLPLLAHLNLDILQDMEQVFSAEMSPRSVKVWSRHFRTSFIVPMASNVLFELHLCDNEPVIVILHNELEVYRGNMLDFMEMSQFHTGRCEQDC